ncbi:tRNA pseudouridine synthase A [Mycoplasma capricolum subsp. capripneumoniae]|uniref:tRNA pseudouridine synthase A n=1 Tax=Mycoplasma capricolum TaxID=2095 RepID=UPI0004D83EA8|nr:tRNA pseudouridine synthase A [Mycoplasma capricolum]KEY84705.1 tRNA pseudouridine synthase A [Mycoplasma capricolum subsp. capripneumoniae 99108]QDL19789.1 tRNA pseudouridine synthase A [Mycoplasma capricolum subsp. capripneumoniae]QDL20474.1 tRNA pseudouridine synthase A [Mycoplasma capricolum subsp. capripneumoniae]QDL21162.1 tRNA pseudouridine synthase A [Mycoplasma capricolum subsp. capripneumoniae]QIF40426.1 tRNA pseudouridine synthase A [Mycoplasma capricolum subsp. capripneumoniae]
MKTGILLTLCYDGSNYHGWINQTNSISIQTVLNKAIKKVIKTSEFKTIGASKTDANVHALDQKVLLIIYFTPILEKFINAINKALPEDIRILNAKFVDPNFNIREVDYKIYNYYINDYKFDIFTNRYEYFWKHSKIDILKLQEIFNLFIGEHEFKLFSGLKENEWDNYQTKRIIDDIKVLRINDKVVIQFKATGFIRYQIRIITANCLNAYLNYKVNINTLTEMLQGIGKKTPFIIKAKGLVLQEIKFK